MATQQDIDTLALYIKELESVDEKNKKEQWLANNEIEFEKEELGYSDEDALEVKWQEYQMGIARRRVHLIQMRNEVLK